ncbi:hypothetical protein [Streptomyces sp. Ag82_O1-15]|uniref:hypothetical protein n=1 Tax=Streptomyces sp. Ag82_O1-15 TaxID=1938855 RepID=UPI000BB15F4B|nr:hypothetical protein [Streptomyces sp. Ag82_O1-15]
MTTTASRLLGRWCATIQQSDVVVRVPARILAQRLLESGGLRDELRRFALAREGVRHEVRRGWLRSTTRPWSTENCARHPSHLGYAL